FCHFENEDGALFCEQCKSDLGLAEAAGVQQEAEVAPHRLAEPAMPLAADVVDEVKVPEAEPVPHLAALEGVDDDLAHVSVPVAADLEDQEPPDRIWSSRQHALISFEEGQLAIEDLNSTNGTFVNRTRVHPGQKRPLQVNDVIQIGTVQMKVKI